MISVADALKTILSEQNITQRQMAEKSGFTEVSICRYINEIREPKYADFTKILDSCGYELTITERN